MSLSEATVTPTTSKGRTSRLPELLGESLEATSRVVVLPAGFDRITSTSERLVGMSGERWLNDAVREFEQAIAPSGAEIPLEARDAGVSLLRRASAMHLPDPSIDVDAESAQIFFRMARTVLLIVISYEARSILVLGEDDQEKWKASFSLDGKRFRENLNCLLAPLSTR